MMYFLIAVTVFIAHQITQTLGFYQNFLDAYLDPFLFFPIVLFIAKKWNQYYSPTYKVTYKTAAAYLIIAILLFEIGFPKWTTKFEKDWFDIIAYTLGLLFYMIWMNETKKEPF